PTQQTFDRLQAAQGYAALGEKETARRLLDEAANRAMDDVEPPPPIYWYTEPFFLLNIGVVTRSIGEYREAAGLRRTGLDGIPADQQGAQWLSEYKEPYADARQRA